MTDTVPGPCHIQRILAEGENSATVQRKFVLSWNHYQILSHVENPEARAQGGQSPCALSHSH